MVVAADMHDGSQKDFSRAHDGILEKAPITIIRSVLFSIMLTYEAGHIGIL